MAGKHKGANSYALLDHAFDPKGDRAYSEGRETGQAGGLRTANPHVSGSPDYKAWDVGWVNQGNAAAQIETCWE